MEKKRNPKKPNIWHCVFLTIVSALLLTGALTLAWYSHSAQTDTQLTTISVQGSSAVLYIADGTAPNGQNRTSASVSKTTSPLFPISTVDCVKWYYANDDYLDANGDLDAYGLADFSASGASADAGLYFNPNKEGEDKTTFAYMKADFVFYSVGGDLSEYAVYLNPSNPITVSGGSTPASLFYLDDAVRIAVVDTTSGSSVLKFIYAPMAESGKGNSKNTTANAFWGVSGVDTVTQLNTSTKVVTPATLAGTGCIENGGNPLCIAGNGSNGHPYGTISVYLWLEGTDAQTKLGRTDNVTDVSEGLRVTFNFVGIDE